MGNVQLSLLLSIDLPGSFSSVLTFPRAVTTPPQVLVLIMVDVSHSTIPLKVTPALSAIIVINGGILIHVVLIEP